MSLRTVRNLGTVKQLGLQSGQCAKRQDWNGRKPVYSELVTRCNMFLPVYSKRYLSLESDEATEDTGECDGPGDSSLPVSCTHSFAADR